MRKGLRIKLIYMIIRIMSVYKFSAPHLEMSTVLAGLPFLGFFPGRTLPTMTGTSAFP